MQKLVYTMVLALAGAMSAHEGDFKKLDAQYALASEQIIDPAPNAPPTQVLILIGGVAAKEIFDAMPGSALTYDCAGESGRTIARKVAGGLECEVLRPGTYSCSVGITLDSGRTRRGYVCD